MTPQEAVAPVEDIDAAGDLHWRAQARRLVGDLFERSPAIYWADFLLSISVAWALTYVYFTATPWSAAQIASFLVAGVLFYRAGTFIHEIVHMPGQQMTWFKRVWNLLLGIPLLMPWVLYRNHAEHHNPRSFGTPDDGEYLPLASSPTIETFKYLAQAPLLPLFQFLRFAVIGPLSWLHPKVREWVLTRVSAAVSNPHYAKRFPKKDEANLLIVEGLCFAYIVTMAVLLGYGYIHWAHVGMAYALLGYTLALNWVRNLAAHRYGNPGGGMSLDQQVSDSINITGQTWLTVWLFPVGLRYHALHHLFPALPYHNMGAAHRRLMEGLPADAPYRAVNSQSYFASVRELLGAARKTERGQSAMRAWPAKSRRA